VGRRLQSPQQEQQAPHAVRLETIFRLPARRRRRGVEEQTKLYRTTAVVECWGAREFEYHRIAIVQRYRTVSGYHFISRIVLYAYYRKTSGRLSQAPVTIGFRLSSSQLSSVSYPFRLARRHRRFIRCYLRRFPGITPTCDVTKLTADSAAAVDVETADWNSTHPSRYLSLSGFLPDKVPARKAGGKLQDDAGRRVCTNWRSRAANGNSVSASGRDVKSTTGSRNPPTDRWLYRGRLRKTAAARR